MRKFIVFILILVMAGGALALYLSATTPKSGEPVHFPLLARHRALLARVPASAESFAMIPVAAALHAKLAANPLTAKPLADWSETRQLPRPWMLGHADLLVWKSGKQTNYLVTLDPVRAALLRIYLMTQSGVNAEDNQLRIFINASMQEPLAAAELERLLGLTAGLPPADLLIVQRERSSGAFPPIGRPSATAVQIAPKEVLITARAAASADARSGPALATPLPAGAMISGAFSEPPRVVNDLNRVFGANVSQVLRNGGSVAIYEVNTGTLVPRPKGVFSVHADAETRKELGGFLTLAEQIGETRDTGDAILISIDDTSMERYLKDRLEPSPWPANAWTMRMNPALLVPVLEKVADNPGVKLGLPRISRSARDLRKWIRYLDAAQSVDAANSIEGTAEVLRVRITSK